MTCIYLESHPLTAILQTLATLVTLQLSHDMCFPLISKYHYPEYPGFGRECWIHDLLGGDIVVPLRSYKQTQTDGGCWNRISRNNRYRLLLNPLLPVLIFARCMAKYRCYITQLRLHCRAVTSDMVTTPMQITINPFAPPARLPSILL
jgi:hypothetical protein